MIRFAIALVADDRGRADRHALLVPRRLLDLRASRWCWSSRSICAASSAWGRSAGSTSASLQLQPSSHEDRAGAGAGAVFPPSAAGECRPAPLSAGAGADDRGAGAAGAEAARSRHRDDAARGRRGAVLSRRRAAVDVRGWRRLARRRRRRWPGRCCATTRRAGFYTFLDPERDPLGAGYHILQSKIALGSGGLFGKGFLQGTQSHLSFLPEKQTDFIFTMIAEEFGLVGGLVLLALYLAGDRLCLRDRAAQPQPVRPAARAWHRDQFLSVCVHQHGDGDWADPGGRRAAAADLLWRDGDDHGDARVSAC